MALPRTTLGRDAQEAFCKALGLDPSRTQAIHIEASYDDFAVMHIKMLLTDGDVSELTQVMHRYKLADQLREDTEAIEAAEEK